MRHKQKHVTNIAESQVQMGGCRYSTGRGEVPASRKESGRVDGGQGKQHGLARGRKRISEPSFSEPDPPVTGLWS